VKFHKFAGAVALGSGGVQIAAFALATAPIPWGPIIVWTVIVYAIITSSDNDEGATK